MYLLVKVLSTGTRRCFDFSGEALLGSSSRGGFIALSQGFGSFCFQLGVPYSAVVISYCVGYFIRGLGV